MVPFLGCLTAGRAASRMPAHPLASHSRVDGRCGSRKLSLALGRAKEVGPF
jgi:hypothetical protein